MIHTRYPLLLIILPINDLIFLLITRDSIRHNSIPFSFIFSFFNNLLRSDRNRQKFIFPHFLTELRKLYTCYSRERVREDRKRYHVYRFFFFTGRTIEPRRRRKKEGKERKRKEKWKEVAHASVELLARSVEREQEEPRGESTSVPLATRRPEAGRLFACKISRVSKKEMFPAREETYQRFHVDVRQIVLVREIKGFRVHLPGTRVHARPLQVRVLTNRQTRAHCSMQHGFITRF